MGAFGYFLILHTSLILLPIYGLEIGCSEFQIGLQSAVFFIFAVIFRIYFGPLADRRGRKIPLLIGTFVFSTSSLLFIISKNSWILMLSRIYQSIGMAAFLSTASSLVADVAPANRLGTYIGCYRLVSTFSVLIGPVFSLFIVNKYGFTYWFIFSFIIGLISFLLMLLLKTPAITDKNDSGTLELMLDTLKSKKLWPIYFGLALASLGYGAIFSFGTLYISQSTTITNPGVYFTYFGLVSILSNLSVGYLSDRFGRPAVAWPAVAILALGIAILFFIPTQHNILIISGILTGIGYTGAISVFIAWLVDASEKRVRATVLSIQESVMDVNIALSSFIIGVATILIPLKISFALVGLLMFPLIVLLFLKTKDSVTEDSSFVRKK